MASREGNLEAPTRHALDWQNPDFYNQASLDKELERVFDICHGCRRCVSLCRAFPTLFDLVDESPTMEVDGVNKADFMKVVDQCYLCDVCYMTKCPYVPPHSWNVDFPHLLLRAKAAKFKNDGISLRDRFLSNTDLLGSFAGIPIVTQTINAVNKTTVARKVVESALGVDAKAWLPEFAPEKFRSGAAPAAATEIKNGKLTPGMSPFTRPVTSTTTSRASATICWRFSITTAFLMCWSRKKPAAACPSSNKATSKVLPPKRPSTCRTWPSLPKRATRS